MTQLAFFVSTCMLLAAAAAVAAQQPHQLHAASLVPGDALHVAAGRLAVANASCFEHGWQEEHVDCRQAGQAVEVDRQADVYVEALLAGDAESAAVERAWASVQHENRGSNTNDKSDAWRQPPTKACVEELVNWLARHGADVSSVEIRRTARGLRLFHARNVRSGALVFHIPQHLAMSRATIGDTSAALAAASLAVDQLAGSRGWSESQVDIAALMMALVHEAFYCTNTQCRWTPWLRLLPSYFPRLPLMFATAQHSNSAIQQAVATHQQRLSDYSTTLADAVFAAHPLLFGADTALQRKRWRYLCKWAYEVILLWALAPTPTQPHVTLVPLVDMMAARSTDSRVTLDCAPGQPPRFVYVARRDAVAGSEVFASIAGHARWLFPEVPTLLQPVPCAPRVAPSNATAEQLLRYLHVSIASHVAAAQSRAVRSPLVRVLEAVMSWSSLPEVKRIDVSIDTNDAGVVSAALRDMKPPKTVSITAVQPAALHHPFLLTHEHVHRWRRMVAGDTGAAGAPTTFVYLEDDMVVPAAAVRSWARDTAALEAVGALAPGFQRGFVRVEEAAGRRFVVDVTSPQVLPEAMCQALPLAIDVDGGARASSRQLYPCYTTADAPWCVSFPFSALHGTPTPRVFAKLESSYSAVQFSTHAQVRAFVEWQESGQYWFMDQAVREFGAHGPHYAHTGAACPQVGHWRTLHPRVLVPLQQQQQRHGGGWAVDEAAVVLHAASSYVGSDSPWGKVPLEDVLVCAPP